MKYADYVRGWSGGLPETVCGLGSRLSYTEVQREWLPLAVKKHGIKSIADVGAGDLNWMRHIKFDCQYTAYDLVPRSPDIIKYDILTDEIPEADCIMVLWVINHMDDEQAALAVSKILNSKARYLLITWRERYGDLINLPVLDSVQIRFDAEIRLYNVSNGN